MRGIYHATVWPIVSDTTNAVPTIITARAIRYAAVRRSCSIMNDRNAPMNGVTKVSHVEDAVKAANITLTADEDKELESVADGLGLNVIRFWEKEMK